MKEKDFFLIRMVTPLEGLELYKQAAEDTKSTYSVLAGPGELYTGSTIVFDASVSHRKNEQKLPSDKTAIQIMGKNSNHEAFWKRFTELSAAKIKETIPTHGLTAHP